MTGPGYGRDRRRRLSASEAAELYARANGLCQRCGLPLESDWHQAHLVAYTNGGATSLAAMEAWCRSCNLRQGSENVADPSLPKPREWQGQALDAVLERIWHTGTATLHAAPGAGKTVFAGLVFRRLVDAGLVERMVVVVPNRALLRQWAEALAGLSIHLDYEPRDGFLEMQQTVGSVVTYQGLAGSAAGQIQRMRDAATLFVLDEVHHVADQKAWGEAVRRIVGSASSPEGVHPAGVLNMTGTLFRSSGTAQIATVSYEQITDESGVAKFQAVADFSVKASELIGVELRRPDLYAYSGQVELVDVKNERILAGDIADLEAGPQTNTAVREGFRRPALVNAFAGEAMKLLSQQLATIDNREPLKLLWVAEDQQSARLAADEINKVAGRDFARLIISDEKGALGKLREASRDPNPCAIVAVRMVTEGFDCPQVSVIAYSSATTAVLFLAQTMARAMRVTQTERSDRLMLPAQILIPDNPTLRRAFAEALIGQFHILEVPDETTLVPERERSGVDAAGVLRLPRYQLTEMSTLDLHSATVLGEDDGTVLRNELDAAIAVCLDLAIPEVYAPRVAVAARKMGPRLPLYTRTASPAESVGVQERPADPRAMNKVYRARITGLSGWMKHHVEHDPRYDTIGVFQGQANSAAGLAAVGGRTNATAAQLAEVEAWMLHRVREHCTTHGCTLPRPAREDQS
jgi:superfamily II DNA or RNA helicase